MIIKRVVLTSFAGVTERSVEFAPGLNIVYGENEAGKSTIFSGIEHALLTPTKLTKNRFAKELGRFCPVGGGDTIRVELEFSISSGTFGLKKSWGAKSSSELRLPDGSLVTDDTAVTELLEEAMPASPAVMKAVFLTYQSGMEKVLADMRSSRDALFDLREALRRVIEGGDGYNADRFKAKLEREIDAFYGRWDKVSGRPEQGRGIANPWKQGCGRILTDWYTAEALKADLERVTNGEDELAAIAADLDEMVREQRQIAAFLQEHEKARDFASVRGETLREIDKTEALETHHSAAYDRWPKVLERLEEQTASLEKKRVEIDLLSKERDKIREYDRKRARIGEAKSKLRKALEYAEVLERTGKKLEQPGAITRENFEGLTDLATQIEKVRRELSAGSLSLSVEANKTVELDIRKGLDETERVSIGGGEKITFSADGAVSIGHPDFTITAGPGDADYPALEAEYRETEKKLLKRLASLGVEAIEEASERYDEFKALQAELVLAKKMLEATLAGETIAALETELSSAGGEIPEKQIEEIQEELTTAEYNKKDIEKELTELQGSLDTYLAEYGKREALLDLLLADREKKNALQRRIAEAPKLPEGFDDWQSVVQSCSDYRERADELSGRILVLEKRKAELVAGMPDESAEEIDLQYRQAVMNLEKSRKRAAALERVLKKTNELISKPEIEISDELKQDFENHLREITTGKYTTSSFAEDLPDGLRRQDGAVLSFDQLSSGTRDGFSLALRLAMARCFVGDSGGFLIMDDPLIDMDDNRRPAASSLLDSYAGGVQTIVFTCHESHAALFDEEHVIRLDG